MKIFSRLLKYIGPISSFLPTYLGASVVYSFFGVINFSLIIPLLDLLFNVGTFDVPVNEPVFEPSFDYLAKYFYYWIDQIIQNHGKKMALVGVCGVTLVSVALHNLGMYLSQRILGNLKATLVYNIRKDLYDKILNLQISFFSNERKGDLMSRLTNDIYEVENTIASALSLVVRDPIQVIFIFVFLFKVDVGLTLFTLLFLPVSGVLIGRLTKKLKRVSDRSQGTLGDLLSIIDETIGGLRIIRAFNATNYINSKFDSTNKTYQKLIISITNLRELASPTSQVLGGMVLCVILIVGGFKIIDSNGVAGSALSASEFIAFISVFGILLNPLKSMSSSASAIQRGISSAERIFDILDREQTIKNKENALQLTNFEKGIEFRDVSFQYELDGKQILDKVSLHIPKGKTVALVGPSGGGKSTLVDLIPRFHDPVSGNVFIDGVNLRDLEMESVRAKMGIVSQEAILFNDTVFNNIAFGLNVTHEQIIQAAKIANAHEFIEKLEKGYDTIIGDRGMKLSGGQRQRLTIARAVLKNPPILLLDEATSALDSESEKLVQEALNSLMKNRTTVLIAHRLSTVQHADLIVVVKDGQICEQGTHEELIAKDGLYKKFSQMQSIN